MFSNPLVGCYHAALERLASSLDATKHKERKTCSKEEEILQPLFVYDTFFTEALKHRQLFPYAALAEHFVQELSAQAAEKGFRSPDVLDSLFSGAFSRLQRHTRDFARLRKIAERHIHLEVIPTPALDGRQVFLSSGKVIIPTQIPGEIGYHAYSLFYSSSPQPSPISEEILPDGAYQIDSGIDGAGDAFLRKLFLLDVEQLTETPCFTFEDALDRYTRSSEICTIAFAQNAEYFPLAETALPIVVEKYLQTLCPVAENQPAE